MLFGDEAVWGGDRRTESILKQLITEQNDDNRDEGERCF